MVLPAAGPRATMRFAQRRAGAGTSSVSASGQSDVLRVGTSSVGVNALVQVIIDPISLNKSIDCIFQSGRVLALHLQRAHPGVLRIGISAVGRNDRMQVTYCWPATLKGHLWAA